MPGRVSDTKALALQTLSRTFKHLASIPPEAAPQWTASLEDLLARLPLTVLAGLADHLEILVQGKASSQLPG